MRTVVLVACGKDKRDRAALAAELYRSTLFEKARGYAERVGSVWFILSAKYGLLDPSRVIEPYDQTLKGMTRAERDEWGKLVVGQLGERGLLSERIIALAGEWYVAPLVAHGLNPERPLKGLRIGEQLAWLTKSPSQ